MRPPERSIQRPARRLESLRAASQWVGCTVDGGCAFVTSANGCLQVKYLSVYVGPSTTV